MDAEPGSEKKIKGPEEIRAEIERLRKIQEIQSQIDERKREMDRRKREFSIRYYAVKPDGTARGPHPQQIKFHADTKLIRIASGGNRSGKSTAGVNESVAHMLGYRPWLPETDPNYKVKVRVPNKGLICGESFGEQINKVLIPKLLGDAEKNIPGAIPKDELAGVRRNPQGVIVAISLKCGSVGYLQSYEQKIDLYESADYDWVHLDEPPPRPIWVAIQRGLTDRKGRTWITMTPLKEPWIYDELYTRDDVGLYYFDIEDNLDFGLTREGIDSFARNLTDDEREARLRGKYFHLSGLVYKSYGRQHRIKRFHVPSSWPIWMHIDTHPRTPHHAVYVAIGPDDRKYVVGAIKNTDTNNQVKPFADTLLTFEKEILRRRPDDLIRLIDPFSQTPDPLQDGMSISDAFSDMGIRCKPGSKNRDSGILLMQQHLNYNPDLGIYPMIFFFDDLDGMHMEMTHYIWDDWQKKVGEGKTEKQEPKKKNDHYIEGVHRVLLEKPVYFEETNDDDHEESATKGASPVTGY